MEIALIKSSTRLYSTSLATHAIVGLVYGIVIIEALSLKTPFVAAEIPPVVEASGRKGGLFYEPKNYKQLAKSLLKLLTDDKLYSQLQKEGYIQSKNYTKEAIGSRLNDIFNNIEEKKK